MTTERTDRLTNLDISTHYKGLEYWFSPSDFNAAFAYWVVAQSPYLAPSVDEAIIAFSEYIETYFDNPQSIKKFSYFQVKDILTEEELFKLPAVAILNERKNGRDGMGFCSRYDQPSADDDFIDLCALARNVFYMVLREQIIQ
jgi:hypothetical protein